MREDVRLFLVGGAVRDLLLGRPIQDLDLAVEGDAVGFARRVGAALGVPPRVHGRFGTATIETAPGERLDLAATRRETYDRPGALPRVEPATISEDLIRRDFTVNAMALEIAPRATARLWDPFGGQADLARRRLRILHPRSFQDDPTRAYRAARYANRLRFSVDLSSRKTLREAVDAGVFDALSGDRRRRELVLLFSERHRPGTVRWMARLGLIPTVSDALEAGPRTLDRLGAAERLTQRLAIDTMWILYLLIWSAGLTGAQAEALAQRLALAGKERQILSRWPETLARLSRLPRLPKASALAALDLSVEQVVGASVCSRRSDIRDRLRKSLSAPIVSLAIRGRDLVRAGISPGPAVGRALEKTLAARRDGRIGRKLELDFAVDCARREAR